jgi:hypothetical protein
MSKLLIVHDLQGKLIAVGELNRGAPKGVDVGVIAREGQGVFETERAGELTGMALHEIHLGYRADIAAKRLVKKN